MGTHSRARPRSQARSAAGAVLHSRRRALRLHRRHRQRQQQRMRWHRRQHRRPGQQQQQCRRRQHRRHRRQQLVPRGMARRDRQLRQASRRKRLWICWTTTAPHSSLPRPPTLLVSGYKSWQLGPELCCCHPAAGFSLHCMAIKAFVYKLAWCCLLAWLGVLAPSVPSSLSAAPMCCDVRPLPPAITSIPIHVTSACRGAYQTGAVDTVTVRAWWPGSSSRAGSSCSYLRWGHTTGRQCCGPPAAADGLPGQPAAGGPGDSAGSASGLARDRPGSPADVQLQHTGTAHDRAAADPPQRCAWAVAA